VAHLTVFQRTAASSCGRERHAGSPRTRLVRRFEESR
jgi:hypothetical protein